LNWTASTDNVKVTGYQVYRNGARVTTTALTTYSDTGLAASTAYTYTVSAFDAAGNTSAQSSSASASTSASSSGDVSPYSTTFPLSENPVSEGGRWINGKAVGLDWADVQTTPGHAFGTQDSSSVNYADSTAVLSGTWGPNQTAQATVHTINQNSSIFEEVELRLRTTISAHRITGYEFNYRCTSDGSQYAQIVRWNGALGDWTSLDSRTGPGLHNGDVVKATISGSTLTIYINNVAIFSVNDSTYSSGSPGIGFYLQNGNAVNDSDYGFTSFTASDGTTTVDTTPPSVPTNLSGSASSSSQIHLTWTASTDNVSVAGYHVFRNGNAIASTAAAAFSDSGLTPNTTYNYSVSAYDSAGNVSARSAPVSVTTPAPDLTPPSIPSGLQSSNVTSSSATLTWNASTDNVAVAGYQIFRNGSSSPVGTTTATSYTDSGLAPSTLYYYAVSACDTSNNCSIPSSQINVTTAATPVIAPSIVQVNQNQVSSGASASAAFNVAAKAGNTIVAFVIWSNTSSAAVTDSQGDTFASVSPQTTWGSGYSAQVFYATNIAGGATTLTAAFRSSVTAFGVVYIHEYAGISAANPIDAVAAASGASASMSSGNLTTASANDLIFGAGVSDNSVTAAGTGFNARDLAFGNITEDRVGSAAGSYSATATHNGSMWAMQVVAFRAAN
jgi:chitodextrinase